MEPKYVGLITVGRLYGRHQQTNAGDKKDKMGL
jgi:hypothetical protein